MLQSNTLIMATQTDSFIFSLFKEIADQSDDVYFIYDRESKSISYLNDSFEGVFHLKRDMSSNSIDQIMKILHPDDKQYVIDKYRQFLRQKKSIVNDFRIRWPNQEERWLRCYLFPYKVDKKLKFIVGYIHDDSAFKRNMFLMQKINTRKDCVLEILSHDLKGPFGIVQMLSTAIEKRLPIENNKEIHEWLQFIQEICKRNILMISDLVNTEFLESTAVDMDKERIDLVSELKEAINTYKKSQVNILKNFTLTYSHGEIYAQVDSLKFMQVINNLISNAIKFTYDGGNIHIHIARAEDKVVITISDDGIGIPKHLQPYLFDRFTKARRIGIKGEESVGLGMSLIKTVVELHKGTIKFKSEENKGSEFFIEIPGDK